jgi:hypothetical protein
VPGIPFLGRGFLYLNSTEGGFPMVGKSWRGCALALLLAVSVLGGTQTGDVRADDVKVDEVKATDEGKAEDFKGKAFDLKEKGLAGIVLTFPADKKVSVTVRSDKQSDVNLFVYDAAKKLVVKDDSPGPECDLSFTPKKAGKYTLVVLNKGPGANRSTLKVAFDKEKDKKDKE